MFKKVIGLITKWTVQACTNGLMVGRIKVNGKMGICMEEVYLSIQMGPFTRDHLFKI